MSPLNSSMLEKSQNLKTDYNFHANGSDATKQKISIALDQYSPCLKVSPAALPHSWVPQISWSHFFFCQKRLCLSSESAYYNFPKKHMSQQGKKTVSKRFERQKILKEKWEVWRQKQIRGAISITNVCGKVKGWDWVEAPIRLLWEQ